MRCGNQLHYILAGAAQDHELLRRWSTPHTRNVTRRAGAKDGPRALDCSFGHLSRVRRAAELKRAPTSLSLYSSRRTHRREKGR